MIYDQDGLDRHLANPERALTIMPYGIGVAWMGSDGLPMYKLESNHNLVAYGTLSEMENLMLKLGTGGSPTKEEE